MTGEKNRGTTQEKLWNLDDKSLATPAHDELILKLLDKNYVKKVFPEFNAVDNIRSEVPIKNRNGFPVGYWDIIIEGTKIINNNRYSHKIWIEVKPKIDSFGTVLRQINTYKQELFCEDRCFVFLFTPDVRFKDAFESQGIKVISPLKEG